MEVRQASLEQICGKKLMTLFSCEVFERAVIFQRFMQNCIVLTSLICKSQCDFCLVSILLLNADILKVW